MSEELNKARDDALKRIKSLEAKRRAQIEKAIGKVRGRRVKIIDGGALWVETTDGYHWDKELARELLDKGVSGASEWTPLPEDVSFEPAIEEWENAGRLLK